MQYYIFPFTTQYNASLMMFEYSFWDLGDRIQFLSNEELSRGDVCEISSITPDRVYVNRVALETIPEDIKSIVCISNAIPFDEGADIQFTTDQEILIQKKVTKSGNSSYLLLMGITPNIDHTVLVKELNSGTEAEIKVLSVATLIEES